MNRTIWKIILRPTHTQEIEVPVGAEILCAREQIEQICIWFRCDPTAANETRTIDIVGTGHPASDGRYVGTASLSGGQLIFHVFERAQP